jgi:hypothetical protein
MNNKFNLKIENGFVDFFIKNTNKTFGNFILRTWYDVRSPTEIDYHSELIKATDGINSAIYANDYYENHNIDQLKSNNLASKMLYSQCFIEANLKS